MDAQPDTYDFLCERAYALGEDDGKSAASWYFDYSASRVDYERVLRCFQDGDPAIYDTLPSAPLSGEWAGDPTPSDILEALDVDDDDDAADDYLRMYEDGFGVSVADEVERLAREALDRLGTPSVDMDAHYRVSGYGAVAWYLVGFESSQIVRAIMVGDDRVEMIDVDDLEQIGEMDYCAECGQIRCTHDGRDRDDDDDDAEGGDDR